LCHGCHLILSSPRVSATVTAAMWQRDGSMDAPVNKLMVRSQSACSFQGPGIAGSRRGPDKLAAFSWLFHDREGFCTL
jgi:hypothetical protein